MLQYAFKIIFWIGEKMENIDLESFMKNPAITQPMAVKKGNDDICLALNDEDLLLSIVVPNMEACNLEQQGESLEVMQSKAQQIAQTMKMDI